LGASAAWGGARAAPSKLKYAERRDLFPEGVASADPQGDSVILWTRRPPEGVKPLPRLTVEVAEDVAFQRVVASAPAVATADSDWTSRVLVGGLKPGREYWYRFVGADGFGSRIGTDNHGTRPQRPSRSPFRLRLLPERQPGGDERLPPHDLRGRARGARQAARFRLPPRRLHL